MADYISRQAVLNKCGDWYVEDGPEYGFIGSVNQMLDMFPAADVVPVVRCRDCKHLSNRDEEGGKCWRESGFARAVENNDFCSYGERKE